MTGQQYELLPRSSDDLPRPSSPPPTKSAGLTPLLILLLPLLILKRLSRPQTIKRIFLYGALVVASVLSYTYFLNPSYANAPAYNVPKNARVFIAANVVDKEYRDGSHDGLVLGRWGDALTALTGLLKSHNVPVYVSVYGGPSPAISAFDARLAQLKVPRTIISEDATPIDLNTLPRIEIPAGKYKGEKRIKRIAYLAAVRNKALEPLVAAEHRYTHLLFVNDVIFSPDDAMRLLFSTNASPAAAASPHPNYRAACALDFITSWKFYDSYASRDYDGYGIGVPLFPWFGGKSSAVTRNDLLRGREAVRVKACWGGMAAFEARFFQGLLPISSNSTDLEADTTAYNTWAAATLPETQAKSLPISFRAEPHPFWDASECCLVHADISSPAETGIYINPHVRVAYSSSVFDWLPFSQRFERLWSWPQKALNYLAGMPKVNVLRDKSGARSYLPDADALLGVDLSQNGTASGVIDGFCQVRQLLLLREGKLAPGMRNWENVDGVVPPIP